MASYRSSATGNGGASSVTISKPSGLTAGDLMVAFISNEDQAINTPSGWSLLSGVTSASFNQNVSIFVKVASAGDAAASDFTFTCGGTVQIEGVLYAISGTFAGSGNVFPYSLDTTGTEAVSDVFRCPVGITPTTASSLLIMYFSLVCSDSDNNAFSAYAIQTDDPTWTERADIQDNGGTNNRRIGSATATRTEVTATGYFQAAISTGAITEAACIGVLLAVADTANGTHNASVVTAAANIIAPAASGGSTTSPSVVTATTSIVAPTTTGGTNDALWKNTDKSSTSSFTNTDKS